MFSLNSPKGFNVTTCYNKQVDGCLRRDVNRGNVVSGTSESTSHTPKLISCQTVLFDVMLAPRADMRGSLGINKQDRNPRKSRLIGEELSQLIERPRMQATTLSFANRYLPANPFQIFKGNRTGSVFSFGHQLLGNPVVGISPELPLFPGKAFQMAFSTLGADPLEAGFQSSQPFSHLIYLRSRICLPITIHREVDDAQIHAEHSCWFIGFWDRDIHHNNKIEHALPIHQIGLPSDPIRSCALIISENNGNDLASFEGRNGDGFKSLPRQDTLIIDNRPGRTKLGFDGFVPFIDLNDFRNGSDSQLGRQPECFTNVIINELQISFNSTIVSFEFPSSFLLKRKPSKTSRKEERVTLRL